jgi:sodium/potassium-transporting ATPase subunit alpha
MQCGIISNPPSLIHDISALSSPGPGPEFESNILATPEKSAVNAHLSPPSDLSPPSVTSVILSGPEMMTLTENQWGQLCKYNEIVFARTTPEQKLRIVRELQSRAEVVAMTGDGVNDAPSLKAADIGIALGSGSDIAIEAADMVLLEFFSAVVEAVQYGRVVFDNLKTIVYLLPAGSFAELWPVITNVLFGLPQVLSSFLMIVICCFTDAAAATVLVYEVPEADVLLRKPRNLKSDRLVDWQLILQAYGFIGILETVSSFAMSYWYLQRNGIAFSDLWFK